MKFYVIEGDNGTGKDTLAAKFQNDGFEILTYDKKIKQHTCVIERYHKQ